MRRLQVASVVLLALAPACGGGGSLLEPDGLVQTGLPRTDASVVGIWRRTVVFTDDFGFVHSSETTWRFGSDGSATRTVVARNLSTGFGDTIVASATWSVDGATLVIQFLPPDTGESRLSFRVEGVTLTLASFPFTRIT